MELVIYSKSQEQGLSIRGCKCNASAKRMQDEFKDFPEFRQLREWVEKLRNGMLSGKLKTKSPVPGVRRRLTMI